MNKQDKMAAGGLAVIVLGMCVGTAGLIKTPTNTTPTPVPSANSSPQPPLNSRPQPSPGRLETAFYISRDLDETWTYENKTDGRYLHSVNFTFKDIRDTLERAQRPFDGPRYAAHGQILSLRRAGTREEYMVIGNKGHYTSNMLDIKLDRTVVLELYEENPPYERLIKRFTFSDETTRPR